MAMVLAPWSLATWAATMRYLDANRNKTDAELEAKYGLSDGKTSVAGLVLYARELFGTQFRFDPTLSDEKGADGLSEVDKHILGYFTSMLYTAVTGLADDNVLPKLNFIMTRKLDNGKEGSNQTNVSNTTKKIGTAIDTILNPRLKGVTDGNYKLTAADKEMLDKAVEAAVKVVESAINDSDTTKRVEYATPDTLQTDLRAYIESYYYRAALKLVAPDGMVESLAIRTVTYKTASSLATLAASRLTAVAACGRPAPPGPYPAPVPASVAVSVRVRAVSVARCQISGRRVASSTAVHSQPVYCTVCPFRVIFTLKLLIV